jgi:uncharacterized protein YciI
MTRLLFVIILSLPKALFAQNNTSKSESPNKVEDAAKAPQPQKFEPITLFFVMLIKGPNRNHDSLTAAKIQEGHMANITKLANSGKLITAGPFMEDANWRGIFILRCDTKEEAEELVKTDPAVVSGRLTYEVHPWMTGKNCLFK